MSLEHQLRQQLDRQHEASRSELAGLLRAGLHRDLTPAEVASAGQLASALAMSHEELDRAIGVLRDEQTLEAGLAKIAAARAATAAALKELEEHDRHAEPILEQLKGERVVLNSKYEQCRAALAAEPRLIAALNGLRTIARNHWIFLDRPDVQEAAAAQAEAVKRRAAAQGLTGATGTVLLG